MICYFLGIFLFLLLQLLLQVYIQAYSTGLFRVEVISLPLTFAQANSWLDFRTFFFTRSAWTVGPLDDLVVLQ